jgi:hypothetical protein
VPTGTRARGSKSTDAGYRRPEDLGRRLRQIFWCAAACHRLCMKDRGGSGEWMIVSVMIVFVLIVLNGFFAMS